MKIEYAITPLDRISDTEELVSVEIIPEERLNGFSGTTLQFTVNPKTQKKNVLERVKWKVLQEVGRPAEGMEFIERSGR